MIKRKLFGIKKLNRNTWNHIVVTIRILQGNHVLVFQTKIIAIVFCTEEKRAYKKTILIDTDSQATLTIGALCTPKLSQS